MLTFPHRKCDRRKWKILYRIYRISQRELGKALDDMLLYGTGAYIVENEMIRHIPVEEIILPPKV